MTEMSIDELKEKADHLEQFVYVASHDLQEPLRMVSQFTELLFSHLEEHHPEAFADPKVEVYAKHMRGGAEKGRKLIQALLSYSRAGRNSTFEMFSLRAAAIDAIDTLNGYVDERGGVIEIGDLPEAHGDDAAISRVFLNLFSNAMKYAVPGRPPRVSVSHVDAGDQWEISVSDNGMGVDPRHSTKIFGIFQRLRTDSEGTGVGLAIVKKLIERHGGHVWVESSGTGNGSTFKFTLPKKEGPGE
jgi:signal transduction histidine kinase